MLVICYQILFICYHAVVTKFFKPTLILTFITKHSIIVSEKMAKITNKTNTTKGTDGEKTFSDFTKTFKDFKNF